MIHRLDLDLGLHRVAAAADSSSSVTSCCDGIVVCSGTSAGGDR